MPKLQRQSYDDIDGWNSQDDETYPFTNNMLKMLENKIMYPQSKISGLRKPKTYRKIVENIRPSTVRVRPSSSNKFIDGMAKTPMICLGDILKNGQNHVQDQVVEAGVERTSVFNRRNRSANNHIILLEKTVNKENAIQKDYFSVKFNNKNNFHKQEMPIKKQSVVFNQYESLKNRKSSKNITKFQELQAKVKRNKLKNNNSQKFQIVFQKSTQIPSSAKQQKFYQTNFATIFQRQRRSINFKSNSKIKANYRSQRQSALDVFSDGHLSQIATGFH